MDLSKFIDYPMWVKITALVWLLSSFILGAAFIFIHPIKKEDRDLNTNPTQDTKLLIETILSRDGIHIQLAKHWLNMSSFSEMVKTRGDTAIYTEPEWRINSIYLEGENKRNQKIEKIKGYIESTESKKKIGIKIDSYRPDEIYGIPANADFKISAIFPRSTTDREGLTFEDFWREFGAFDLYIDFDGTILTKQFSHKEIQEYIDSYIASLPKRSIGKPRVERKK